MEKKSLRDMISGNKADPGELSPEQREQVDQMRQAYDKYKDKSPGDIARELNAMKSNKNIQDFIQSGKLDEVARNMRPYLGENASRLDEIIRGLKR